MKYYRFNDSQLELEYDHKYHKVFRVKSEIIKWLKENNIKYRTSQDLIKYVDEEVVVKPTCISFEKEEDLTIFLLAWN